MLVLTRKANQQIQIGEGVIITILQVKGNTVRVGIEAPREVRVMRGELEPRNETDEVPPATLPHPRSTPAMSRSVNDRMLTPVFSAAARPAVAPEAEPRNPAASRQEPSRNTSTGRVLHLTRRSGLSNLRGFVLPR